jgi:hypothetical protein
MRRETVIVWGAGVHVGVRIRSFFSAHKRMRVYTRKYLSLCWLCFQSVPGEKISINGVFQPSEVGYDNYNTERILTLSMPTYYGTVIHAFIMHTAMKLPA